MRRQFAPILTLLVLTFGTVPALACIHAMAKHKSSEKVVVAPTDIQAIVAWHDGVQDLVLTMGYTSTLTEAEPLAFVVPVPSVPTRYEVVEPVIFDELRNYLGLKREKYVSMRSRGPLKMAKKSHVPALEALPSVLAGPYEIQPLKATGEEGLAELQAWMKKNEFNEIDPAAAGYYVERGWTFLAIKSTPKDKSRTKGAMPPLHLRFASKRAVLPLKLLDPPERMKVTAYFMQHDRVEGPSVNAATTKGFEVVRGDDYNFGPGAPVGALFVTRAVVDPASAPESVKKFVDGLGWKDVPKPRVAVFHSESFGVTPARPSEWAEDFVVPALDEGEKLWGGDKMPSQSGESLQSSESSPSGKIDLEKVVPSSDTTQGAADGARPPTETQGGPVEQPADQAENTMLFTSCAQVSAPRSPTPPAALFFIALVGLFGLRGRR